MNFERPDNLDQALALLADRDWAVLSGGTDYYPALGDREPAGNVLDISAIEGLQSVSRKGANWEIGALATWSDVICADLPPAFDGLKLAAREIGSVQIQNRATLAGNICNASPAADGMPPLLTLDANVRLSSQAGTRELALAEFATGNRSTQLEQGELVTAILVPVSLVKGKSAFRKLGARKYLVISIAMVAVRVRLQDYNKVDEIAISVGSCSLVAQRLRSLEQFLTGKQLDAETLTQIDASHLGELSPISDVRATADYRTDAALQLIRRTIADTLEDC